MAISCTRLQYKPNESDQREQDETESWFRLLQWQTDVWKTNKCKKDSILLHCYRLGCWGTPHNELLLSHLSHHIGLYVSQLNVINFCILSPTVCCLQSFYAQRFYLLSPSLHPVDGDRSAFFCWRSPVTKWALPPHLLLMLLTTVFTHSTQYLQYKTGLLVKWC